MADCKRKVIPSTLAPGFVPNSVSILLCVSRKVLVAGFVMGMWETHGHQLLESRRCFSVHQCAKKLWPLGGSIASSPQENSSIVPLCRRVMRLNSCVTNFNTRGGCSTLKALLSEERAGRQRFNELYEQLCAQRGEGS